MIKIFFRFTITLLIWWLLLLMLFIPYDSLKTIILLFMIKYRFAFYCFFRFLLLIMDTLVMQIWLILDLKRLCFLFLTFIIILIMHWKVSLRVRWIWVKRLKTSRWKIAVLFIKKGRLRWRHVSWWEVHWTSLHHWWKHKHL